MKFDILDKTRIIGLFTIVLLVWIVLYFIPEILVSLFNNVLGNLLLLLGGLLLYLNNRPIGVIYGLIVLLLMRFSQLSKKETFTNQSIQDFLIKQNTINRQKIFDMNVINTQATQEELDYFNQNGQWPWSEEVIELYQQSIEKNPYTRSNPQDAVNYARTIYNETAILRILSYQTKEGLFLLNGILLKDPSGSEFPNGFGEFGYNSELIEDKTSDIIRCNLDKGSLERISYTSKGHVFDQHIKNILPVDYNDLEKVLPGFSFVDRPCNPCSSMDPIPDYSCRYRLNIKDKTPYISKLWQYLWGIEDEPLRE